MGKKKSNKTKTIKNDEIKSKKLVGNIIFAIYYILRRVSLFAYEPQAPLPQNDNTTQFTHFNIFIEVYHIYRKKEIVNCDFFAKLSQILIPIRY